MAKKDKTVYKFYIVPVIAVIVTIVVLCLGLSDFVRPRNEIGMNMARKLTTLFESNILMSEKEIGIMTNII